MTAAVIFIAAPAVRVAAGPRVRARPREGLAVAVRADPRDTAAHSGASTRASAGTGTRTGACAALVVVVVGKAAFRHCVARGEIVLEKHALRSFFEQPL